MKNQFKTVNEIAKFTGITIRTLHYYDQIGLLKPSNISEAGYRLYDNNDIKILQQILFLKEIGFELKQIKEIINNPNFDEKLALKKQKEILILRKKRIDNLIKLVDNKLEDNSNLSFYEFDKSDIITKQNEYRKEVLERFGDTEAYKEFELNELKYNNQINDIDKKAGEIFGLIAKYIDYSPSCEKVQKLISKWQEYITETMYNCTNEMLQCLGVMYVEDERFKNYINSFGDNLAQYISEAIDFYCEKK
ncbi:MerR family transcriptional regulator [Clostridium sp. MB40-C1]|uniref:MerR family transcriptional regulator n=1 Tax=Clostridium sp. MB40-C1 TaxID=3070996 RepID=UPI0027E01332|nr:MerR family transcriptional regulator [Clostridium sp. MB40-C1]WMJ80538.1 MerR family transcriptional regulator [Clostridium sp. MB40-C1]